MTNLLRRRFLTICICIAAAAFLIRMAVSAQLLSGDPFVSNPPSITDMHTYMELSKSILDGIFPKEFYYQPFYYAVFLPLAHLLMGKSAWAVIVSQSMCGAGAVLCASLLAAMLWGRRAGVIAGAMSCLSSALVLYTPYCLIATMQSLWLTLLALLSLMAMKKGGWLRWGAAGIALSLAVLSRGNAWIFLPPMALACAWSCLRRHHTEPDTLKRRMAKATACLSALCLFAILPQVPFAWRNTVATGHLSGPSTAGGAVLSLGNNPEAPPGVLEYPPTYNAWMSSSSNISIPSRIFQWFKEEPLALIELSFRKAILFWDWHEIPNNISFDENGRRSSLLPFLAPLHTAIILTLALASAILFIGRFNSKKGQSLLFSLITAYWIATAIFYILARFRVPAIPMLCAAGAGFLELLIRDIQSRRLRKVFTLKLLGLASGAFIVFVAYDHYRMSWESSAMRMARPDGVRSRLSENEFTVLDNGPSQFGGWIPLEVQPGMQLTKRLVPPDSFIPSKMKISISYLCNDSGAIDIQVNGVRKYVNTRKSPSINSLDLEIHASQVHDGIFEIRAWGVSKGLYFLLDTQRDYGRTLVDGKPSEAELVLRANFIK